MLIDHFDMTYTSYSKRLVNHPINLEKKNIFLRLKPEAIMKWFLYNEKN